VLELGIVVLMAAGAASFLGSNVREHSQQESARKQQLQEARSDASELSLAVRDYALSGSGRARDQAITATADLGARITALKAIWPEQLDQLNHTREQAVMAGKAAERLWNGDGPGSDALSRFEAVLHQVDEELVALDLALTQESRLEMTELAERCYAVLAGLAFVHVIVGLTALRRERKNLRRWMEACEGLAVALDAARKDDVSFRVDATLGPQVQRALDELRSAHHGLIEASGEERRHARFAQELIEALEIDDTPEHVYQTVSRAARLRMPGSRFRLLVSDDSGSSLAERVAEGPPLCAAPLPQRCPAIRKGRLVSFTDRSGLARCPFLKEDDSRVLCAPVASAGKAFAAAQLALNEGDDTEILSADLTTLVGTLGTRLGVVRTLVEREQQATTDPLTGLANRRAMDQVLEELDRDGYGYAVLACDLDHFKRLNDQYGHETGDRCLVIFSQVLKDQCREGDVACRPGGEEFLVIARGVRAEGAAALAERIREGLALACEQGAVEFTVSIGIAAKPEHGNSADDLLKIADKALYEAKDQGRDRAMIAGRSATSPPAKPAEADA
jgi:diguanylate cyclase (GGDEF)-like protein